jgi:ribosomal protein S6
MEHGGAHSLAAAVIETIPTVKEYIDKMIEEAEGIIAEFKEWGMLELN